MLHLIQSLSDKFVDLISQDPVRPHIPRTDRVGTNKDIFVTRDDDDNVQAITCVSYQVNVPTAEAELFEQCEQPRVAVFYTIWSYAPGAGRQLIFDAVKHIKANQKSINRFVTLSPKTDMARRFHIKNGAIVFRDNQESVNYEYVSSTEEAVEIRN
jgi:hypothetical protein